MVLEELTQQAALGFLNTVLIVDELLEQRSEAVSRLQPPQGLGSAEPLLEQAAALTDGEVGIRTGPLVKAFGQLGLFATPLAPDDLADDEFIAQIEPLALRADIVVLDWNLFDDDGRRSLALTRRLVEDDQGARVRVLVFYTGRELDHVQQKLVSELGIPQFEQGRSTSGPLRVVVLAKADSTVAKEGDPKASEEELPERLVSIFATEHTGILPTAVLTALAAVREQAHRVLARFPASLDAAFLGHRILLDDPSEAGDHLPLLVGEEIAGVLMSAGVGSAASQDQIEEWLHGRADLYANDDANTLDNLLSMHRGNWQNIDSAFKGRVNDEPALAHDPRSDPSSDDRWAEITATTQLYSGRSPVLALGTIVVKGSKSPEYWLCLQPLCDAVRRTANTKFPFLPLVPAEDRFQIVVGNRDKMVRLKVVADANAVKPYTFAPSPSGMVEAKTNEDGYWFTSTSGVRFWWLGNLKPAAAQRVVHRFASNVSRIGLEESEWLRRKADGSPKRK
jgi:hypothetical protein